MSSDATVVTCAGLFGLGAVGCEVVLLSAFVAAVQSGLNVVDRVYHSVQFFFGGRFRWRISEVMKSTGLDRLVEEVVEVLISHVIVGSDGFSRLYFE